MYNEPVVNLNVRNNNDTLHSNWNNNNLSQIDYGDKQMQHAHNPYVKLSLDNEDFMKVLRPNASNINTNNNIITNNVNNTNTIVNNQEYSQNKTN